MRSFVESLEPRRLLDALPVQALPAPGLSQPPKDRIHQPLGTFTNPIGLGADPWVMRWQGFYYYAHAEDQVESTRIYVHKSRTLQDIVRAPAMLVWQSQPGTPYSTQVWAPELWRLDGKWYIYFTATDQDWINHRNFVLEADASDPQGSYHFKSQLIVPGADHHAIDGSILEHSGQRYFLYSGHPDPSSTEQRIYLTRMSNPWTLSSERTELSRPDQPWELTPVNEGPTALIRNNKVHVIFSVNFYWMSEYSLAQVTFSGGDILDSNSWVKRDAPVFVAANGVSGVGHASFSKSPDNTQDWVVYHSMPASGIREVRIQPFGWHTDDSPDFGEPVGSGVPISEPSWTTKILDHSMFSNEFIASGEGDEEEYLI